MNEILINILGVVVSVVVLPLISVVGTYLVKFINSKMKNDSNIQLLTDAITIVTNAVKAVMQSYVENLKKNNSFDDESKKIALQLAKDLATEQMSEDIKNYLYDNFGSVETWLTSQIEAIIYSLKKEA